MKKCNGNVGAVKKTLPKKGMSRSGGGRKKETYIHPIWQGN